MPKNYDFDIMRTDGFDNEPVLIEFGPIKIFWGPNQFDTGFTNYNDPSGWRELEQLNLPQVIRFHHNGDTEYDTDGYNNAGGGGPAIYPWTVVNYNYGAHDGILPLSVIWRNNLSQEATCITGTLDTPANFAAMQTAYPLGLVHMSSSNVSPCADVML